MHLKIGSIVIPHFAHYQQTACRQSFAEGETAEHLLGKQQLFEFFEQHAEQVQVEPYLQQVAQRPDLLVSFNKKVIPIEFQCSPISHELLKARTQGYKKIGMSPVWIMRTPESALKKSPGIGIFELTQFQQYFIENPFHPSSCLISYHPESHSFYYFSHLLHVGGKKFAANYRKLSAVHQTFPFARPKTLTIQELSQMAHLYNKQRNRFVKAAVYYNRKGVQNRFLKHCYELRILPMDLPEWIGVPVTHARAFKEHVCEWQTAFIHFHRTKSIQLEDMNDKKLDSFLFSYKGDKELMRTACFEYIHFLQRFRIDTVQHSTVFGNGQLQRFLAGRFLALPHKY